MEHSGPATAVRVSAVSVDGMPSRIPRALAYCLAGFMGGRLQDELLPKSGKMDARPAGDSGNASRSGAEEGGNTAAASGRPSTGMLAVLPSKFAVEENVDEKGILKYGLERRRTRSGLRQRSGSRVLVAMRKPLMDAAALGTLLILVMALRVFLCFRMWTVQRGSGRGSISGTTLRRLVDAKNMYGTFSSAASGSVRAVHGADCPQPSDPPAHGPNGNGSGSSPPVDPTYVNRDSGGDIWYVNPLFEEEDEQPPASGSPPLTRAASPASAEGSTDVAIPSPPLPGEQRKPPALTANRVLGGLVLALALAAGAFLIVSHFERESTFYGLEVFTVVAAVTVFLVLRGRLYLWLRERSLMKRESQRADQQLETVETRF